MESISTRQDTDELSLRQGMVLLGLIDMYIRTARPVGSMQLAGAMNMSMSAATVRNIFRVLEEDQYVFQPHTSAGRVPTSSS
jgi:heat-inducible transcriptional repressor